METLHSIEEMIDLNPLVEERHPIKAPSNASPEEFYCTWYSITDKISYLPGGMASGRVTYNACFHNLEWGVQTHCYAPMGLNIKGKWTLGGSLPGEPIAPVEIGLGAPLQGLYLREDVDMKCNVLMTSFVKKTTMKAHSLLVERLVAKAHKSDATYTDRRISAPPLNTSRASHFSGSQASTNYSPIEYSPSEYESTPIITEAPQLPRFENNNNTQSLYPQPLKSTRNSVASYQTMRKQSLPEQLRSRTRSPSPTAQQTDDRARHDSIKNELHYQVPTSLPSLQQPAVDPRESSFHAELEGGFLGKTKQGNLRPLAPPPQYGHAELQ
jgi:hypothetical protein